MDLKKLQNYLDELVRDKSFAFSCYEIEDQYKWDEKSEKFQEKYEMVHGKTFPERNRRKYETKFENHLERLNDPWSC